MNEETRFSVSKWPLLGLFAIVALSLAAGGYWLYHHETQAIRIEKFNGLKGIVELKTNQIVRWRQERIADARLWAQAGVDQGATFYFTLGGT